MKIELCAIGGYSEVGENMTAIKIGNEVIICDMGFYLPEIIKIQEEEIVKGDLTREQMIHLNAVPDDSVIEEWKPLVKAIVVSHCHLDHIGAIPYLAEDYNCPIYGTPYSIEVLKTILRDEKIKIKNKIVSAKPNSTIQISKNIKVELLNITHSTPQTVFIAIHTPEGTIVYGNDFKLDNHPVVGNKPNYKRMKEIQKKGVLAFIGDALYSDSEMKTPSEKVAREMLKDVLLGTDNRGHLVIVTTFASQIARLKSIVEFGRKMGRKIVFLGRSLHKYTTAAERAGILNFSDNVEICGFSAHVKRKLKQIQKNPGKYLVVCTGNQGEPRAILTRLALNELPYKFKPGDHIVFSCRTIPTPLTIANRTLLEAKLKQKHLRLFKDIHSSGHAAREDHRDLINLLKPKHIIPAHGDVSKLTAMASLAEEMGYKIGKTVHIMSDGQTIELK